jgi:uncharacterized DUF497 family protein
MIEWDETKRQTNIAKHGIDFAVAEGFNWNGAYVVEDVRFDYGETRFVATGNIGNTAYTMVFTPRGRNVRIISLRPASREERKRI